MTSGSGDQPTVTSKPFWSLKYGFETTPEAALLRFLTDMADAAVELHHKDDANEWDIKYWQGYADAARSARAELLAVFPDVRMREEPSP